MEQNYNVFVQVQQPMGAPRALFRVRIPDAHTAQMYASSVFCSIYLNLDLTCCQCFRFVTPVLPVLSHCTALQLSTAPTSSLRAVLVV